MLTHSKSTMRVLFKFGPCDFADVGISAPEFFSQSELRLRAD